MGRIQGTDWAKDNQASDQSHAVDAPNSPKPTPTRTTHAVETPKTFLGRNKTGIIAGTFIAAVTATTAISTNFIGNAVDGVKTAWDHAKPMTSEEAHTAYQNGMEHMIESATAKCHLMGQHDRADTIKSLANTLADPTSPGYEQAVVSFRINGEECDFNPVTDSTVYDVPVRNL